MQNIILDPRYYLKPNDQRSANAIMALRVLMIFQVLHAVITLSVALAYDPYVFISPIALLTDACAGYLVAIVQLAVIIFLILWMRRAYANLFRAGAILNLHDSWAGIGWFIPIINLFFPYRIAKETWIKTQDLFRKEAYAPVSHAPVRKWWIAYLLPSLFVLLFYYLFGLHEIELAYYTITIGHVIGAIACVNGVRMIRDFTKLENDMHDRAQIDYNNAMAESAREYKESQSAKTENAMDFPWLQPQTNFIPGTMRPAGEFLGGAVVDNSGRAKFLQACLGITAILLLVYALVKLYIFLEIDRSNLAELLSKSDAWTGRLDPVLGLMFAATITLSMLWMHQAYSNLHNLNVKDLAFGKNMAAVSWIIPGANFYFVYAVVNDIAKQTPRALMGKVSDEKQYGRLFNFSWLCFIISILFLIVERLLNSKEMMNSGDLSNTSLFGFLFAITGAFALILASLAVGEISNDETMLFERAVTKFKEFAEES